MNRPEHRVGILAGLTASGKSQAALAFAQAHGRLELINADSIVVYRGLDIGSAKPSAAEQAQAPHHLIDIRDPDQEFNAGDFVREVELALAQIHARGNRALIVGGTGFYLKALLYGMWEVPRLSDSEKQALHNSVKDLTNDELWHALSAQDPAAAEKIHPEDRYRLIRGLEIRQASGRPLSELQAQAVRPADPRFSLWVLDRAREELDLRIRTRAQLMLEQGLIEETKSLMARYPEARPLQSVGYAQVVDFIEGRLPEGRKRELTTEDLLEEISLATRQLCKRQRTWFRGEKATQWFLLEDDRARLTQTLHEFYTHQ